MESKTFEVGGRQVEAVRVDVPAGRAAFDLETQRTVRGPGKVWQVPKEERRSPDLMISEDERQALTGEPAEAEKPKRGRPPRKEAPPDL